MKWNSVNSWLEFGNFQIEFGHWFGWSRILQEPSIFEWSLFNVQYDNGAFWGLGLGEPDEDGVRTNKKVDCYLRVVIFGVGFRYNWEREIKVILPDIKTVMMMHDLKQIDAKKGR